MDNKIFTLVSNENIASGIFKAVMKGDTAAITVPGQFVNLKLDGLYLRRPISVCDCVGDELTLIYKVVGEGTERMSAMAAGERLFTTKISALAPARSAARRVSYSQLVPGNTGIRSRGLAYRKRGVGLLSARKDTAVRGAPSASARVG